MRTIFSQVVVLKPVPVIVIEVPDGPRVGVIDVTVPIVHGVNKNCKRFVGVVCEHEDGLINELVIQDEVGIVAKFKKTIDE